MVLRRVGVVLLAAVTWLGCATAPEHMGDLSRAREEAAASLDGGAPKPGADRVEIVRGVPNNGRDPAVVAIDVAGEGICSGTLVSPRLVLTALHCVSRTVPVVSCPPSGVQVFEQRDPQELEILAGEDIASSRSVARGIAIVAPSGVTLCDSDIALIVLDQPVVGPKPLPLRTRGPAAGDRVRAVGYGKPNDEDPAGKKLLREHVRVLSVTSAEFTVGEATCSGDSGGPAIDPDTGEVIGVVSRGGPQCEGADVHNIYTRVDTYAWLMEEAFVRVSEIELEEKIEAGAKNPTAKPAKRGTKQKLPSDMGNACTAGDDCAAGICIIEDTRQYCSRPCGSGDRCPNRYHCKVVEGLDERACINVR